MDLESLKITIFPILFSAVVTLIGIWTPLFLLILIPGWGGLIAWLVFMVLFVAVTSGRLGWPNSAAKRAHLFRSDPTTPDRMRLGFALAFLFVVIGQATLMVTFRLVPYPREAFLAGTNYEALSPVMVWLTIILSATGAGVYEEIGFRGYMQVPLEEQHGFLRANILVSLIFMTFHLNQAWAPAVLFWLFFLSFLFGIIAYVSGSLVPGIVGHVILDIFNFGYWWSDFFGVFNHQTIFDSGIDQHFWFWSTILIVSSLLFVYVARYGLFLVNRENQQISKQPTGIRDIHVKTG